jgi:GGDEF domain-containing protein
MMARLSRSRLAVLIPGSGENLARDIAERMRRDVEDFAMDDGRGAVLQVTLSIGLVTWEPQQYPAVDMPQLARQMDAEGLRALELAQSNGGNRVETARLSTLIV